MRQTLRHRERGSPIETNACRSYGRSDVAKWRREPAADRERDRRKESTVWGRVFSSSINGPGEIVFKGSIPGKPLLEVEEGQGDLSRPAKQLVKEFQKAGVTAALSDDASLMLWEKFCWIAGVSGVTAATRQPIGIVRADPDMRALFVDCVRECAAVGRAAGVPLDLALEERLMGLLETNPAEGKSSLLVDLERGRPLELDGLSGAVHRLGGKYHVATPVTSATVSYTHLRAHET